jgi:hypothetical protein
LRRGLGLGAVATRVRLLFFDFSLRLSMGPCLEFGLLPREGARPLDSLGASDG